MSEEKLIGWLCFVRFSVSHEAEAMMPGPVTSGLLELGWISASGSCEKGRVVEITEAGRMVSDLHAEEWGIEHQYTEGE